MANALAGSIASTRFVAAALTPVEADVFDQLCETSGLSPTEVGSRVIAFVCRSISGLRKVQNRDIDTMLADEFGDIQLLLSRLREICGRTETAIEASQALVALIKPAIAGAVFDQESGG